MTMALVGRERKGEGKRGKGRRGRGEEGEGIGGRGKGKGSHSCVYIRTYHMDPHVLNRGQH